MYRLLFLLSILVIAKCQLNVRGGPNATLVTYLINDTVVSTEPPEEYQKQALNDSVPVSITCEATFSSGDAPTVTWYRDGKVLTDKDFGRKSEMEVKTVQSSSGANSTLYIHKPKPEHAAAYVCEFTVGTAKDNATAYINSPPLIAKFDKAKRAIQGDKLKVSCNVAGFPKPDTVTWYFMNTSSEWTGREGVTFDKLGGVEKSKLMFASLESNDDGIYYCSAKNYLGEDMSGVRVRAKNRLDALWPFLCIVAEVVILVTIILIYEKKRSNVKKPAEVNGAAGGLGDRKDEEEEADADNKDVEKDDLRQRSVKT